MRLCKFRRLEMENKILEKFERKWGHDSCIFIPKCKDEINTLKVNLEYSENDLEILKDDVCKLNAKIKITEKLINGGIQK